jgi:hypothetical protein
MATLQETISGAKGGYLVTGTNAKTRAFNSIQMNGDTVISELYYADDTLFATNIAGSSYLNLAGNSMASGMIILCEAGKDFGKIKLTSGSVLIH